MKIKDLTVIINLADSKCGSCRKGAFPDEGSHLTVPPGYDGKKSDGCGTTWEYMTSEYMGRRVRESLEAQYPYKWVDLEKLDNPVNPAKAPPKIRRVRGLDTESW